MRPLHRPHFVTTAILVGLVGTVTGLAAASRIGPFDALGAGTQAPAAAQQPLAPLRADSLYPTPTRAPATHEQIVVADPPGPARAPAPTSRPTPTPEPEHAPPSPTASPTPRPCDDDGCGPGGDG